jgi:hypothetical protein
LRFQQIFFCKKNLSTKLNETDEKDSKGNKNPNKYPDPPTGFENKAEKIGQTNVSDFCYCS